MDPDKKTEEMEDLSEESAADESTSVEDFIKELEAKEKDLHITAETTFIELAADFDEGELPEFLQNEFPSGPSETTAAVAVKPAVQEPGEIVKLEQQIGDLTNRIVVLQGNITELQTERRELHQTSARRAKDFEAFKTRTERERKETMQTVVGNLATQMLPALDNLNRAVEFAGENEGEQPEGFKQFFEGIVLVNEQVNEVLAGMGIQTIASVGETFDPHFHEAVATDESEDFPPNTVSAELLRGYRIGDRVIRHSMVKVSNPGVQTDSGNEPDASYGDLDLSSEGNAIADADDPEDAASQRPARIPKRK